MTKVLVLYYSAYGHIETMAEAVAEGVRQTGAEVVIKRVPELVPEEVAQKSGYKLRQAAPIASIAELPEYGRRQPSAIELDGARFQGRHVGQIASKLAV